MDLHIVSPREQAQYYDEILEMLYMSDDDFIPPLSARSSTTQKDLTSSQKTEDGILQYFEEMKSQRFMVALEDGKVMAFVSYRENYVNGVITEAYTPNIYLSTLIMRPEARGKGLTKTMYSLLFKEYEDRFICTRTWSTNIAHKKILDFYNFSTFATLPDDRGKGIDTVYFMKKPAR
ncbi:MAG: GNAT family N-acetyltransferase [Clostridia bacterium]|nr:GNAT family N-acetyltransferase [Clostridia bacterium]